jgi:hypothetical protein
MTLTPAYNKSRQPTPEVAAFVSVGQAWLQNLRGSGRLP